MAGRQKTTLRLVGVVTVVAVLACALSAAWWLRVTALAAQRVHLDDVAAVLAEHAGRTIESIDLALAVTADAIGAAPPHIQADPLLLRPLLRDPVAGLPHVMGTALIDAAGQTRSDSSWVQRVPVDVSDRDYFRYHATSPGRQLYIGAPVWNRLSSTWVLPLTRRIDGPDGLFRGVVVAAVNPSTFSDFYRSLSVAATGAIFLARTDGEPLVRQSQDGPHPGSSLTATRAVDRYPLSIVVTQRLSAALAGWRHQATVIACATALLLLVVNLVGGVLLHQAGRLETTVRAMRGARDEAVRARLREEDAGRAKSAFLANTSHELRTPLNAVLGFSEVLRDGHLGPLPPKQAEYAAGIHQAGTHLLTLINDLLDMARIDARQMQLREAEFDLSIIVAEGIALTGQHATARGVTIEPRLQKDFPLLRGDPQRLRQIVLNLLSNAAKFTESGGRVWIETSILPDGSARLAVGDTGIGMAEHEIAIALTPFRQVDSSMARQHEGTGLGLPIVKALVELHSGELTIDSIPGEGTLVTVLLPADRVVAPRPARASAD